MKGSGVSDRGRSSIAVAACLATMACASGDRAGGPGAGPTIVAEGFDPPGEPQWRPFDRAVFEVTVTRGEECHVLHLGLECRGATGCPPGDGIVIDRVRPGATKATFYGDSTVVDANGHRDERHGEVITDTGMIWLCADVPEGADDTPREALSPVADVLFRCGFARAARARKALDALLRSPEGPEQRQALAEFGLAQEALVKLLDVVQENAVLADLFWDVVESPSPWSVITHLGVKTSIFCDFPRAQPIPVPVALVEAGLADEAWRVPFSITANGEAALEGTLDVVEPRGALRPAAGVIAIDARRPGRDDLKVTCRLVAARRGMVMDDVGASDEAPANGDAESPPPTVPHRDGTAPSAR